MHHKSTDLGNDAATGAVSGAWCGWLLGLCIGLGLLTLPELGLVVGKVSVETAFLSSIEGGAVGVVMGGLGGALIGWTRRPKEPGSMDRHG